ncbi:MAG: PPOX class F420-dependent oxidoreductase [Oscillochloridaceae bacterium umkhey_bin13]
MSVLSEAVRAFIDAPRFAVLAVNRSDGAPQLSVMWYELRGDELMMNTTPDRAKTANLRRDPRVSVCIEDGYRYITLYGTAHFHTDPEAAQADIARLAHLYQPAEQAERMINDQFSKEARVTFTITIERVVAHL